MIDNTDKIKFVPDSNLFRGLFFIGLGVLSVIIGVILTPSLPHMIEGIKLQQTATGLLDLNTFDVVGKDALGVPFINSGLLLVMVMLSYLLAGSGISGGTIAAAMTVFGFGFCGNTLWSFWPLFFGVIIHAVLNQKEIKNVMAVAWFSSGLSPMVSIMTLHIRADGSSNGMIGEDPSFSLVGFTFAVFIGLIAGYLVATLVEFLALKHNGFTLYDTGFGAGLVGFLIYSVIKITGHGHTNPGPHHVYEEIASTKLLTAMAVLLLYIMIIGLWISHRERDSIGSLVTRKCLGSAVEQFGFGPTLVNMAVCGYAGILYYALTVTASVHGPFFACVFTMIGFASNGITLKSMAPILGGVYVTSFVLAGVNGAVEGLPVVEAALKYVGSKNMLISAIYGCGMAPVVYKYGSRVGFIAAGIHSVLIVNTGVLQGWMNLYNNAFCLGLVTTFFVPLIVMLLDIREEDEIELEVEEL